METGPIQLTRAAQWAKRWADTLPSLQTKENFTLLKYFTKYKISSHKDLMLQWGSTSALRIGSITFQASPCSMIFS